MTVSSDVNKITYAGNGSTQVFSVNYYFLADSHLQVVLITTAGVETVQTLTTNYTVTGAGNEAGGSITMLVAPPIGVSVVIQRVVPATQETDYLANDPFPAESHERALDKLTMLVQQNERDADRAIKVPIGDNVAINKILPSSTARANKVLGFSAGGDVAITNSTITQIDAAVASFVNATGNNAASILYDPDGVAAIQTTVQAKLRETVSVKDFGAVGDGVTDDTAAIQAAINFAAYTPSAPKRVFLPNGKYKTTNTLHIGYGVFAPPVYFPSIVFEGDTAYGNQNGAEPLAGIYPTFNDRPAINVQGCRLVIIRNIAVTGVNYAWAQPNWTSITDRSVVANYYGPNMSAANNTQHSPYCGICVDAYSGTLPADPYPAVDYPAFLGTGIPQYNKNYNSLLVIDHVSVEGFAVGVMIQPGVVPDASQGDFNTLRDCVIQYNIVDVAWGNPDNRNPNFYNCRLGNTHTSIDTLVYGSQKGAFLGNLNGCTFDASYQILNVNLGGYTPQGGYSAILQNCYAEDLYRIGVGYTEGKTGVGLTIAESKFAFSIKSTEYSPVYLYDALGTDLIIRNVTLLAGYAFSHFNANVKVENLIYDSPIADVFAPSVAPANKIAESFTCGIWANKSFASKVTPIQFSSYAGDPLLGSIDSEALQIDFDNQSASFARYGFPIPWFVNFMASPTGNAKYAVSNVPPLVLNRATYNLSAYSATNNFRTFTCDIAFITDGHGAATEPAFSVGLGDFVVDNATGQCYFVTAVSFPGGTTMTATMSQVNAVSYVSGTTFTAGGSFPLTSGTLTFYNARRVYPSDYRVSLTATSGTGTISWLICGTETNVTSMTLAARVDDYLISSNQSQSVADSTFPSFTKITVASPNGGNYTVSNNARRTYFGETLLVVRGT